MLASATPSVETEVNARRGRYARLHLPERFGGQHLPAIEAIDLRREGPPRGRFIAPRLAEAVKTALERGEQALLFLNRRGYAPLTLCRACGYRLACPNCDAWLVDHRFRRRLVCHHCGFSMPQPDAMPEMPGDASRSSPVGPGVERLERGGGRAVSRQRASWCCPAIWSNCVERLREELDDVAQGRFDIVIGTQLVAKGHHFPKLNLVGIVDADLGLANGDPRAAERTFQLLHQVVGRAGREDGRGIGYPADAPARASGDARADRRRTATRSTRAEIDAAREDALSAVRPAREPAVVSGADKHATEGYARRLAAAAPRDDEVRVLGPAEAPLALVRGRYRFRLLVKSPRDFDLSAYLRDWLAAAPKTQGHAQARSRHRSAELFVRGKSKCRVGWSPAKLTRFGLIGPDPRRQPRGDEAR